VEGLWVRYLQFLQEAQINTLPTATNALWNLGDWYYIIILEIKNVEVLWQAITLRKKIVDD
jgi:hypothetical protein